MKKFGNFILVVLCMFLVGCSGDNNSEEYRTEIQNVADKIMENSENAEKIVDQYITIWDFSIENRMSSISVSDMAAKTGLDEETIKRHFKINAAGNIPGDFSLNVMALHSYFEESGEIAKLKETAEGIKEKINELNNPPEEFEKVYDELLDLFTHAEELLEMAIDPSGSYNDFTAKRNQLSSDITSQYKRVEVTMPSK